jgi:Domain of unknown function (DUF4388)/PilZ domain
MLVSGELENVPLLDVLQVVSHAKQSGILSVEGSAIDGNVLFERGGLVCAESTSSRPLFERAALEQDPRGRTALRRVAALAALTELLGLRLGTFRFRRVDGAVSELSGVKTQFFYDAGPMDTGELLLVVATAIDKKEAPDRHRTPSTPTATATETEREREKKRKRETGKERSHPRFSPTLIPAVVAGGGGKLAGHLTNVSEGGAFFHGYELPERESSCRIQFSLPGAYGMVEAAARVAWVRIEGSVAQRGAGLSFLEMTDDARARLDAYLQHYQRLADEYRSSAEEGFSR